MPVRGEGVGCEGVSVWVGRGEYVRDRVYVRVMRCSMDNIEWNPSILVNV